MIDSVIIPAVRSQPLPIYHSGLLVTCVKISYNECTIAKGAEATA